jgi:hypothetical protein
MWQDTTRLDGTLITEREAKGIQPKGCTEMHSKVATGAKLKRVWDSPADNSTRNNPTKD